MQNKCIKMLIQKSIPGSELNTELEKLTPIINEAKSIAAKKNVKSDEIKTATDKLVKGCFKFQPKLNLVTKNIFIKCQRQFNKNNEFSSIWGRKTRN